MKLLVPCITCNQEPSKDCIAELLDDQTFEFTCDSGHTNRCVLQVPRYELLYESGALALVDGYPREAVTSFAASVERFYEFWLEATLAEKGLPESDWRTAWKAVANQSERQFGAFAMVHLAELATPAPLLAPKLVEFRNKVVHKGYWPRAVEAQSFGEAVVKHIMPLARDLRQGCKRGVVECLRRQVARGAKQRAGFATTVIGTILSRATAIKRATGRLDKDLKMLERRRRGLAPGGRGS